MDASAAVRTVAIVVGAALLGACAAIPELQYVDDGLADGSTSPTSVGDPADAAPGANDGSTVVEGAADAAPVADSGTCTIPPGFKVSKCCGSVACIGDHCNAAPTCGSCAMCANHAFCCAMGTSVTCGDDVSTCK